MKYLHRQQKSRYTWKMDLKKCPKCGKEQPLICFNNCKSRPDGLQVHCKACLAAYRLENKQKTLEYARAYSRREGQAEKKRAYYEANKDKLADQKKQNYIAKRDKYIEYGKRHRKENAGYYTEKSIARRLAAVRATPPWANKSVILFFYTTSQYMSEQTGVLWNVDHVIPLRGKNVCGLHVHGNLRVITAKENREKSNKFTT